MFCECQTVAIYAKESQQIDKRREAGKSEKRREALKKRTPTGQHVKMFKQVRAPPAHVRERAYPKLVAQETDVDRYVDLKFKIYDNMTKP